MSVLALIAVFFFLPIAAAFLLSFTDFDIYAIADARNVRLVGFANYTRLLGTNDFWHALRVTLYFAVAGGPLSVAASLGAALLVNAKAVRLKSLFRTIYFAPFVTTLVAVAIVWRYLYHPRYGLIDFALGKLGLAPIDWLGDPHWAMPALILMSLWGIGTNMIIILAGLQGIPDHLYEAARIDGAGAWSMFRRITIPMLRPVTLVVITLNLLNGIKKAEYSKNPDYLPPEATVSRDVEIRRAAGAALARARNPSAVTKTTIRMAITANLRFNITCILAKRAPVGGQPAGATWLPCFDSAIEDQYAGWGTTIPGASAKNRPKNGQHDISMTTAQKNIESVLQKDCRFSAGVPAIKLT